MKYLLNFLGIPKNYVSIYNTIKDPHWYVVQVIRRGGNDDDQGCLARTTKTRTI